MSGRRPVPRPVRLVFWEGIRAGMGVKEAGQAAGVSRETARLWFMKAGGVTSNGPGLETGRYLSMAEREEIAVGRAAGLRVAVMAARLGRPRCTVYRELARNSGGVGGYRATIAQQRTDERRCRPKPAKIAASPRLRKEVQARLRKQWSPAQIAVTLRQDFPDDPEMWVSHETVYQSLYVQGRGALRRELAACLRTGRALRKPRRKEGERRGRIPGMVMISERPAEAADRAVPGHWEGDLERHEAPCDRAEVEGLRRWAVAAA